MYEVRVISVFVQNQPGKLERITKVLAESGANILGFSITSVKDFGVIKFLVDKTEEAYKALKEAGFTVALNEALGIEMEDRPGGLHKVVKFISEKGVNIENALVYVEESRHKAYFIFEVDDLEEAKNKLES
jgi:hypothetical protein